MFGVLWRVVFIKPSVRRDEWMRAQPLLARLIRVVREKYAHGKIPQKLKQVEMRALLGDISPWTFFVSRVL